MSWNNIFFVVDHSKLGINNPFLVVEIHSNKMSPHLDQHQPSQSSQTSQRVSNGEGGEYSRFLCFS